MASAEPLQSHYCTRECRENDTHAVTLLATPFMRIRDVWQDYAAYTRRHGWHVREVVRLPPSRLGRWLRARTVAWGWPVVWVPGWGWAPAQERHGIAWRVWIAPGGTKEENPDD